MSQQSNNHGRNELLKAFSMNDSNTKLIIFFTIHSSVNVSNDAKMQPLFHAEYLSATIPLYGMFDIPTFLISAFHSFSTIIHNRPHYNTPSP